MTKKKPARRAKKKSAKKKSSKKKSVAQAPTPGDDAGIARHGKCLWIWIGVGIQGTWLKVLDQCESGGQPWTPPRTGSAFEVIWTEAQLPTARSQCDEGWCEYDENGDLENDYCSMLGPPCYCKDHIDVPGLFGIGIITMCYEQYTQSPSDSKSSSKRGKKKSKRGGK